MLAVLAAMALLSNTPEIVSSEEMLTRQRWVAAHLDAVPDNAPPDPGIEIVTAYDLVQKNAHRGQPLRIGNRVFARGLYCHAPTRLRVRLPGPAKTFAATVGVDNNAETRVGRSSIIFVVHAGSREATRSPVMRVDSPARALSADLGGAKQFDLELTDAGDGIHSDQGVWGDARVTLADGRVLMLDDLPLLDGFAAGYRPERPFSFRYGGRPSTELLPAWRASRAQRRLDDGRVERTLTWTDLDTGLEVRCVSVEYTDFPTVEWTVWLRNTGKADTPLIEEFQGADLAFARNALLRDYEFALHHHNGTVVTTQSVPEGRSDFAPRTTSLEAGSRLRLSPPQGRPSAGVWPYFNVESAGKGAILAVGWPGCWAAEFERDTGASLRVRCGQERTRFRLHPGEEARSPLVVLQFWSGERVRSQNVWRRWMLAYNVPRPGGRPLAPMTGGFDGYYFPELQITEAGERAFVDRYAAEKLLPDFWWIDAGWYPCRGSWVNTGTWEADRTRFPGGLRAAIDHAHARGIPRSVVWFEPERVTPGSWLDQNRPQWLLGREGETRLLDLGNPEARAWITERVSGMIRDEGIDVYRQDFNMDPLPCWRAADAPDRQGMTENRYVRGYLAFWDALLQRHPNLLIDTCASGAHRDDLETLRRSVPLWRSDYPWEPVGMQCQTYGISSWVPYHGTGVVDGDPYTLWSDAAPFLLMSWDMRRKDLDYAALRRMVAQWRAMSPCLLGDFYPLTEYTQDETAWMAWQFDRPERGEGVVQAFRRERSPYETARFTLRGLRPEARYRVRDLIVGRSRIVTGRELMDDGLAVALKARPAAAVIHYRAENSK